MLFRSAEAKIVNKVPTNSVTSSAWRKRRRREGPTIIASEGLISDALSGSIFTVQTLTFGAVIQYSRSYCFHEAGLNTRTYILRATKHRNCAGLSRAASWQASCWRRHEFMEISRPYVDEPLKQSEREPTQECDLPLLSAFE